MNNHKNVRKILLTLLVPLMLGFIGCKNGGNTGTETSPDPEITSVNPTEGPTGTAVMIEGSGFSASITDNEVTFNGTPADITSATTSRIETRVPEGATTGAVRVTVAGVAADGPTFSVIETMPGIQSVEPDSGVVGTEIVITGTNFSANASENSITFNGVSAPVISASETELITEVPQGAADGPIEVSVNDETAVFSDFNVITTGTLEVTISTTGEDPDTDGYVLRVGLEKSVETGNDEIRHLSNLEEGIYELELQGIDRNCAITGEINIREVTITPGDTTSTSYEIGCLDAIKNQIVFISDRSVTRELYVMETDGSNVQQLTANTLFKAIPSISPDGTKIAFMQFDNGVNSLYLIDADGSNLTKLIDMIDPIPGTPSWFPDGTKLLFSDDRDGDGFTQQDIYSINIDGTGLQLINDSNRKDSHPVWSPDGNKILFVSQFNRNQELVTMNSDGSNIQLITDTALDIGHPVGGEWSPDGSRIAFTSNRDSDRDFEIYVMNADGTGVEQLTENTDLDISPVWSPDGSKLIFMTNRDTDFEIYSINADGTGSAENISNFPDANELGFDRSPVK